jgi:deoxyribonuclease I
LSIQQNKGFFMPRSIRRTFFFLFLVSCFLGTPHFSEAKRPEGHQKESPSSPEHVYRELCERIDLLEEKHPQDHAVLFQMRELAQQLFRAGTPDPCDPQTLTGVEFPDLEEPRGLYGNALTLTDESLKDHLEKLVSTPHAPIGYSEARVAIFSRLDNQQGKVHCVYTGQVHQTTSVPDASVFNTEHTWPQSLGATGIAKSDLHHLFPTESRANGIRGNLPFGWVSSPDWSAGGSKCDRRQFEVRPDHRGNVARAMFYFSVRYRKPIAPAQEAVLREWHAQDPVDDAERVRNDQIQNIQQNRNPFVDQPDFVDKINDF